LRIRATEAGRVLLRGTGFVVLAGFVVPSFGVLSILVAVCLVAVLVGLVFRPRIQISGNLPDRVITGQITPLTYHVKNVGRLPAYGLSVRFHTLPGAIEQVGDAGALSRLGPGESAEVAVTIRPKRRGSHRIGLPVCESSFPFNLFRIGAVHRQQETLLVLPAFSWLRIPMQYVSRHVNTSNLRPAGRVGGSPEYIGSRPFAFGDSPRRIDVRAWARLGTPATKEYDDDLDDYAAFILDTRIPPGRAKSKSGEVEELEAAVSLCASVAYTIYRDCLIDLLLAGPDLHEFGAWPKTARLERIHEVLAGVEPSTEYGIDRIGPLLENRLTEISEIVFIVLHWDDTYRRLVEWADRAGCHATVIVIGEPDAVTLAEDWGGEIRFVSARDILAGRVEQL
jgi:uncharacterized protein (DUF58 family)